MAYPPSYERDFSFTEFETLNPGQPKPGAQLDAEFDDVSVALTATQDALALIQRDDGALANDSVGADQLQDDVFDGIVDGVTADAEAAAAAAAASAALAADSALASDASSDLASTSAGEAAGSAALAGASQTIAQDAANEAALSAAQADTSATDAELAANETAGSVAETQAAVDLAFKWAEYLAGPVGTAPPGYPEAVDDGMWSAKWWALQARDYSQLTQVDFGTSGAGDIGEAYDDWGGTLPPGNIIASWNGDEYWLVDRNNPSDPASWVKLTGDTGATGATGPANSLAIGTVTTLPPGSPATATITGTPPAQTLSLGIPQGATGSGGSGAGGNPTATIGLTAVNGVALTLIRSDGAPALSQAIIPTWTGRHTFANSGSNAGALQIAATSFAAMSWNDLSGTADNRVWYALAAGDQFRMGLLNDALSAGVHWLSVDRTANVIDVVILKSTAASLTIQNAITASTTIIAPGINVNASIAPTLRWIEGSASADEKFWDSVGSGGDLHFRTRTDLDGVGVTWLRANRTGTAVDSIALTSTALTHNGSTIPTAATNVTWTGRHVFSPVGSGIAVTINGIAPGPVLLLNGVNAASSYTTFQSAGVTIGQIGDAVAILGAATNQLCINAPLGMHLSTGGGDRVTISADGSLIALTATQIALSGVTICNSGTAGGSTWVVNSTTALGPYATFQRSGTAFGDFGNGGQMGGGFTLDALAFVARAGRAIQMAAGGSTMPHFQIAADGTVSFNGQITAASNVTWTGQHLFAGQAITATTTTGISIGTRASLPAIEILNAAGAADEKRWEWIDLGGILSLRVLNDAASVGANIFEITRVGAAVSTIKFGSITDNPTYQFLGSGTATFGGLVNPVALRCGPTGGVTASLVCAAGSSTGNAFEWGHANSSGYRSTLGHYTASGAAFLAFHAEHGTTANTFRTRGIAGSVIMTNSLGALLFGRVTNANADNQTMTADVVCGAVGGWQFNTPLIVGSAAAAQYIAHTGPVGSNRDINFNSVNTARWIMRVNSSPESGANAGSNFDLYAMTDAGGVIGIAFGLNRATMNATFGGTVTSTAFVSSSVNIYSTQPILRFNETDGLTDEKTYDATVSGGTLSFRTRTDADGVGGNFFAIARTGAAITNIAFGNATHNPTYSFLGTGIATWNSSQVINAPVGSISGIRVNNNGVDDVEVLINTATAGNAYARFTNSGGQNWSVGNQRSSGNFFISNAVGAGTPVLTIDTSGVTRVTGNFIAPTLTVNKAGSPRILIQDTSAAADERTFDIIAAGGDLVFRTRNDADNAGVAFMTVARTGTAMDSITFSGQVNAPAFNASSSRDIKRETGKPSRVADILARLRPIMYRLLAGDDREQLGMIAEEVHEICPQLSDGKTISYDRLAVLLLADWQDRNAIA